MHKEQKYTMKWTTELDIQEGEEWWEKVNKNTQSPMEVKLRWFQYRVLLRILSTNTFLHRIGIYIGNATLHIL